MSEGEIELIKRPIMHPTPSDYGPLDPQPEALFEQLDDIEWQEARHHVHYGYVRLGIPGRIGSRGPRQKITCGPVDPVNTQHEWLESLGVL